jgi:hypothetical protein
MLRRSTLQRQILHLYKVRFAILVLPSLQNSLQSFLRVATENPALKAHVRGEFRRFAGEISRNDTQVVEYHLRRGQRQLKTLQSATVTNFGRIKINED